MDDAGQKMIDNLPAKTGRSLEQWFQHIDEQKLGKHGAIMKHLKGEHGVTHGFANMVAVLAGRRGESQAPDDLIALQYAKKPNLRPFYDALLAGMAGTDFEVIPKKTAVAWKNKKQFAYLQPSTKTRLDVGVQLKGEPDTERLRGRTGGMTSHVVAVTSLDDVDDELLAWLRLAWERCG